jgi:hypothetical protein
MNVPHYALWALVVAFVIPAIFYFMKIGRDKYNARIAERKVIDAAFHQCKVDFAAFLVSFKTEFSRCDDPADCYTVFENYIPVLKILSVQIPKKVSTEKKDEICAGIDLLSNLKSVDVATNPDYVIHLLEKLEALINSL